jgi:hypothetical protein
VSRTLGKAGREAIDRAVGGLFARLKIRLLGRAYGPKQISFGLGYKPAQHREVLSVPGIFDAAYRGEGLTPDGHLRDALAHGVATYLDGYHARTSARVHHAVQAALSDAEAMGTPEGMETWLGGQLAAIYGEVRRDVDRLVTTEVVRARNVGLLDAATKVHVLTGGGDVADQVLAFLGPNDGHTCEECKRLLYLPDGVTPRCWFRSEISSAYHKRGEDHPSVGGLHPNCRHSPVPVRRGYGFRGGRLEYIGPDHDELSAQRG